MSISFSLLLLLLFCINAFLQQNVATGSPPHEFVRFDLIHRHAPQLSNHNDKALGPPENQLERIKQLVHSDNARLQMIFNRLSLRRKAAELPFPYYNKTSVGIPLRSAADSGIGQFFVSIRVGSPPKRFVLIADTASDLTWMNCNSNKCPTCRKGSNNHPGNIFQADLSRSFRSIPCSTGTCKVDLANLFSLAVCPTPLTPCAYEYSYMDGSTVVGFFANETLSVGTDSMKKKVKLRDVLIGCTEFSKGFQALDGVIGLGYSKYSFAVRAAKTFDQKFSYCLVDHLSPSNRVSYLHFGNHPKATSPKMQYTKLLLGVLNQFYAVNVTGISIGDKMLQINPATFDFRNDGGVILDSGSTLTYLALPVYKTVMAALTPPLEKFKKVVNVAPLEFCFNDAGFIDSIVPKFVWHFGDGATFIPPVKSYVIDTAPGVKCLGIASVGFPGHSVIGNIMQQNHLWEFDIGNSKLGYGPSTC